MKTAIVITTISNPTRGLRALAVGAGEHQMGFFVVGDMKTPKTFDLGGCHYWPLDHQLYSFRLANVAPTNSYTRKNIGYLLAMRNKAEVIIETDDDNIPMDSFWQERTQRKEAIVIKKDGWLNVYQYFSDDRIWPRGLPLDEIDSVVASSCKVETVYSPIQQGLANDDPDVDAIYRLTYPNRRTIFDDKISVAFQPGTWSPFNSQNTTWFREAFHLMYLPSTCSFRMTDIWRSFVAQRLLWKCGQTVLFHSPTVYQCRNEHDLMDDFRQEVPGYLHNKEIAEGLMGLNLDDWNQNDNMRICYEWLVSKDLLDEKELALLDYWLMDIEELQ